MNPPVGKSGPCTNLHDVGQRCVRIVHQRDAGVDDLGEVVRRNLGGHADGDAVRAVDEQVRNARRQNVRARPSVSSKLATKVDGVLVDVGQQRSSAISVSARFGVSVGRRRVAIDGAEVALAIDQRIAQRERLRHAHHRVVHRECRRADGTCPALRRRPWRTLRACGYWAASPMSCMA